MTAGTSLSLRACLRAFHFFPHYPMHTASTSPAEKKLFLFVADTIIEAESEEEAKEKFAWDYSSDFASQAECYEVCDKCSPRTEVKTCVCKK